MKIRLESVSVDDLDHAISFYRDVLGFIVSRDETMGPARIVLLASPDEVGGAEILLEPNGGHEPTRIYKQALYSEGVPATAFLVDDIDAEHARLTAAGVVFKGPPARHGNESMATFDDTCGNLIMIYQSHGDEAPAPA